jgi:hypothetical protein
MQTPEHVQHVIEGRIRAEKSRSRRMLAAKRSLEQVGIVEWVRYLFAGKIWSL